MLTLRERAPLYALSSQLLSCELDAEQMAALTEPAVADVLERAEPGTRAWLAREWNAPRRAQANEEFARLFLVPGGVPPFASAWIDGPGEALSSQLATLVTRALSALGREIDTREPWGRLPLDHVSVLFDVVVQALAREDEAGDAVAEHLSQQVLGEWVGHFGSSLAEKAKLPVYRALGRLVEQLHSADAMGRAEPDPRGAEHAAEKRS